MAKEVNINTGVFLGGKVTLDFLITQSDDITPQNMTGWTLTFIMRSGTNSSRFSLTKSSPSSGITIVNGSATNDKARVSIDAADTVSWPSGRASYALWRSDGTEDTPLAYGTINLINVAKQ